jgi:hypothetical protein
VCKYVDIVVDALISKDKLFSRYISIPHGPCLLRIKHGIFMHVAKPNACGAIDGFYISLSEKLDKMRYYNTYNYYYRWKNCNLVVLQVICQMDKLFWNVCCSIPSKIADGGQFKVSFIYQQL